MSGDILSGNQVKSLIYLIPGQGSDDRLFKNLQFDCTYDIRHISYDIPAKNMTLPEYAKVLSAQIDTTLPYIIIGVSLGGMIATEMCEFMHPEKVIIISSAKCHDELPGRYKFQQHFPIYKIVSGRMSKAGAKILQPVVEPDRNKEKETCKCMLNDKDPDFLKRTIKMILEWERTGYSSNIIHIHGDNDHTIPIRNVKYNYMVKNGSHMMVLTKGEEISKILNVVLHKE